MEIQFTVVPVQPGLQVSQGTFKDCANQFLPNAPPPPQSIGPLTLVDLLSNQKKHHFHKISQVFVEHVPITLTTA